MERLKYTKYHGIGNEKDLNDMFFPLYLDPIYENARKKFNTPYILRTQ
jgi:hypothetical protein